MSKLEKNDVTLLKTWTLTTRATLGSSVRAKGIFQEIQARIPAISKKSIALDGNEITLAMAAGERTAFKVATAIVAKTVEEADVLPVIPREIQDILTIKASERHRWLADGRLQSAATRTVRLNGRARRITFHVFDPKVVEDLLDRGAVDEWRVEDAEAKAEKRRNAAYHAKMKRTLEAGKKRAAKAKQTSDAAAAPLVGWEAFDVDGLLR